MTSLLTDEEVAAMEKVDLFTNVDTPVIHRLITALRDARAEVDHLRAFLEEQDQQRSLSEAYQEWKAQQ